MKKSEIKNLDSLWSFKIKQRANYICECCHRKDNALNSAHIIGRTNRTLRWDLRNGLCLCVACHNAYDQHQPLAFSIRDKVIGKERIEYLLAQKNVIAKNQDFEQIRDKLIGGSRE